MYTFWKGFLSSMLGAFVVAILGMIIFFVVLFTAMDGLFDSKPYEVKENTVLHVKLEGNMTDKTAGPNFGFGGMSGMNVGLIDLIDGIAQAKEDDDIEGIFLDLTDINAGLASIGELREALIVFKGSGKWIVAYGQGEFFGEKAMYLAGAADELYLFPTLVMEWNGLGAERMFFKNALDKLGVQIQIIRGSNNDFKSAVEPFFLTEMSDSARHQSQTLVNNMWTEMTSKIEADRGLSVDSLNSIAENLSIRSAQDAADYGFVDGTLYPDEVYEIIKKKVDVEELDDVHFLDINKYVFETLIKDEDEEGEIEGERIAIIMAEGGVTTGKGKEVHSTTIAKYIREARLDEDVKGIILRVNSPGGSALASDIIWREMKKAKEVKPVYVSMGDVAASGGYYVACGADKIYATEGTITGSIGVFGMIPYTGDMMKEKLGITSDFSVKTHSHSVLSLNKKLTEEELLIIQGEVDRIYDEFLSRVADGREKLSKEDVNRIGRGRVWSGTDALRIGLVDELGSLAKAKKDMLAKVELEEGDVEYYPARKYPPLLKLMQVFRGMDDKKDDDKDDDISMQNDWEKSVFYQTYQDVFQVLIKYDMQPGIKAQLPYVIKIK